MIDDLINNLQINFLNDVGLGGDLPTGRKYCFVLGSGASVTSGIMSGQELAGEFQGRDAQSALQRCSPPDSEAHCGVVQNGESDTELGSSGIDEVAVKQHDRKRRLQ